jgi:hypothetical protein
VRLSAEHEILVRGPAASFPEWARGPVARGARDLLQRLVVLPVHGLVCRPFRAQGGEHVERVPLPALLIANHTSHLDTPSILRALPDRIRLCPAVAAAADNFYRAPLVGSLIVPGSGAAEPGPDARRGRDRLLRLGGGDGLARLGPHVGHEVGRGRAGPGGVPRRQGEEGQHQVPLNEGPGRRRGLSRRWRSGWSG